MNREEIDRLLLGIDKPNGVRASDRAIVGLYKNVTRSALQRHRDNHIPERIERAAIRADRATDDMFWQDVAKLRDESAAYMEDAKRARCSLRLDKDTYTVTRDIGAMGPAISRWRDTVDIIGRATGVLLDSSARGVTIQIAVGLPSVPVTAQLEGADRKLLTAGGDDDVIDVE